MATSSFTKNFIVPAKNADKFIESMQDHTPPTTIKGFTSRLVNIKDLPTKKDKKK